MIRVPDVTCLIYTFYLVYTLCFKKCHSSYVCDNLARCRPILPILRWGVACFYQKKIAKPDEIWQLKISQKWKKRWRHFFLRHGVVTYTMSGDVAALSADDWQHQLPGVTKQLSPLSSFTASSPAKSMSPPLAPVSGQGSLPAGWIIGSPYEQHQQLSLIHIWRCRRIERCRSRWSPYH